MLVGGIFVILAVAMGRTNYLVAAEIPQQVAEWIGAEVESRLMFLLLLNLFLLAVGAMMDIYSAIIVVVPLILPISAAFGIHPLHLGVIFLANLELGYLTSPVGMNLFLSAYRFNRPVTEIIRSVVPFFFVLEVPLHLARIVTLTIRLLANMFADHTIVAVWLSLVPVLIPAVFMGLGTVIAFLQALVFSLLTMVYIGQALEDAH